MHKDTNEIFNIKIFSGIYVAQTITIYAVYVNTAGWYGTLETNTFSATPYYTGVQSNRADSANSTFAALFNLEYNTGTRDPYVTSCGIFGNSLAVSLYGTRNLAVNQNFANLYGLSAFFAKGRIIMHSWFVTGHIMMLVGVTALLQNDLKSGVHIIRKSTQIYIPRIDFAGSVSYITSSMIPQLKRNFNSYLIMNRVIDLGVRDESSYHNQYIASFTGDSSQISVGVIPTSPVGYNFYIQNLNGNTGPMGTTLPIKMRAFTGDQVLITMGFDYNTNIYYLNRYTYTLDNPNHIIISYEDITGPVKTETDCNFWIPNDGRWYFFPPKKVNGVHQKGINSYYSGSSMINSFPSSTSYFNTSHTQKLRSVLSNYYIQEIIFPRLYSTKMIVLASTKAGFFSESMDQGDDSYNPDTVFYFQWNVATNEWDSMNSNYVDRNNIWSKYKSSFDTATLPGATLSANWNRDNYEYFSWGYPANSTTSKFYKTSITFGE